jgi:hypothetical protein
MERVEQGSLTYDNRYNYFLTQSEIGFLFRQDTYDKYFDGHHISNFDDSLQNTRSNTETIALVIKNLFSEYGYDNVFIWDTQTGIPAGPVNGGAQDNTESTQAQYVPRKWTISLVSGIEKSFWTGSGDFLWLNDGPNGYFAHLGLINAGLRDPQMYKVKKLSYYTYKLMIEKLEGSNWDTVQEIEVDENNIHVYRFMQNGKPTFVAWWNYWKEPNNKSKSVNLQLGLTGDVIITQAIPHFENGLLLQQSGEIYPKFFDIEIKTIKNRAGILNLQLNHNPVYIESN